ncbi:MAG TPA: YggS family pyridoxal phosphate-dependent enzyme [Dermatophilaceae bacterium]|nr:YggS family pyridoxal phosphate-dependent enzyme [Dermatophilaceae bacterium]
MTGRRDEIAAGLSAVRRRIAAAAESCGRDPAELTLVVVTKTFPVDDVGHLLALGVRDVGENRDQEAGPKYAMVHERWPAEAAGVTVHFIGQLQTNKAGSVAGYADVVHAVDRAKLARALDRSAAGRVGPGRRPLRVLVQVSLDPPGTAGRAGVPVAAAEELADLVEACPQLELGGVMGVAPLGGDPDRAFARLREASVAIRSRHPQADWISAGMSGDLEAAVRNGATHLRVGSAILGSRASLL